jgi:hypothetical protein
MHYQRECFICGTIVIAKNPGGRIYCEECRLEQDRVRYRQYHSRKTTGPPNGYIVIKDPDPIAGFPRGAHITKEESENMLVMCNFTPETILKSVQGHLWRIVQGRKKQKLVKVYGEVNR